MIALRQKEGVRRSATRLTVTWPVRWDLEGRHEWNEGTLLDVSRFGAYLAYENAIRPPDWGETVAVHALFGTEGILVEGRVRWLHGERGAGIEFLPEEGELAEALLWALSEQMCAPVESSGVFRRPF